MTDQQIFEWSMSLTGGAFAGFLTWLFLNSEE
jgi:hypothetical protein